MGRVKKDDSKRSVSICISVPPDIYAALSMMRISPYGKVPLSQFVANLIKAEWDRFESRFEDRKVSR